MKAVVKVNHSKIFEGYFPFWSKGNLMLARIKFLSAVFNSAYFCHSEIHTV